MAKDKVKKVQTGDFTAAQNRRGRFDYEIEESLEAGLVLSGTEVKSARAGNVQIAEAYARIEGDDSLRGATRGSGAKKKTSSTRSRASSRASRKPELWIYGMYVAPYEQGNVFNLEPRRKRKLLLHRAQIDKLMGRVSQKGYTLVPLKLYFTRGRAKLEIGIGKGRKNHDKRRAISERETRRDIARQIDR